VNYTEMLFNRDERLVNLLNQADSKNLELIEEINNREEEIERLKEELKYTVSIVEHNKTITKHIKEKEQLHSIIKELREYIEKHTIMFKDGDILVDMNVDELLKILDKVGEE